MAGDLNKWIGIGRLTRDAELRFTSGGMAVCKFALALNRRVKKGESWEDEANFVDIVLWGKQGESLNQYLTKGKQVAVEGELHQNRWEHEGKAMSKIEINASNVQLLGGKSEGHADAPPAPRAPSMAGSAPPDFPENPPEFVSDVPF